MIPTPEFLTLTPVLHELRRVASVPVAFGGLTTQDSDHRNEPATEWSE